LFSFEVDYSFQIHLFWKFSYKITAFIQLLTLKSIMNRGKRNCMVHKELRSFFFYIYTILYTETKFITIAKNIETMMW